MESHCRLWIENKNTGWRGVRYRLLVSNEPARIPYSSAFRTECYLPAQTKPGAFSLLAGLLIDRSCVNTTFVDIKQGVDIIDIGGDRHIKIKRTLGLRDRRELPFTQFPTRLCRIHFFVGGDE